jgi:hypothetical protein
MPNADASTRAELRHACALPVHRAREVSRDLEAAIMRAAAVACDGSGTLSLAVGWTADATADLRALRRVHCVDVLLCLVAQHEWARVGVPDVCQIGVSQGLHVIFLPQRREGVPENVDSVIRFGRLAIQLARAGNHVCVAGRDRPRRAHLMAAAGLILGGASVPDAVALIRRARPGALHHEEEGRFLWSMAVRARDTGFLLPVSQRLAANQKT